MLYQNNGDGTFTDVSLRAGIHEVSAPGLGVYCQDLTGDGRLDFYVANDGKANQLWVNQGNGRFIDEAYMLGVALNSFGAAEAGMGIAAGDVDGDSEIDLFLTHLNGETNTLYLNEGGSGFRDATAQMRLAFAGLQTTGFGTAFLDYDHDGDLDIAVANGRVKRQPLQSLIVVGPTPSSCIAVLVLIHSVMSMECCTGTVRLAIQFSAIPAL